MENNINICLVMFLSLSINTNFSSFIEKPAFVYNRYEKIVRDALNDGADADWYRRIITSLKGDRKNLNQFFQQMVIYPECCEFIQDCLDAGANINYKDIFNDNLLKCALRSGNIAAFKILAEKGLDIYDKGIINCIHSTTPIVFFKFYAYHSEMTALLAQEFLIKLCRHKYGNEGSDLVDEFIKNGANIHYRILLQRESYKEDDDYNMLSKGSFLHAAIIGCNYFIAKKLVLLGASINTLEYYDTIHHALTKLHSPMDILRKQPRGKILVGYFTLLAKCRDEIFGAISQQQDLSEKISLKSACLRKIWYDFIIKDNESCFLHLFSRQDLVVDLLKEINVTREEFEWLFEKHLKNKPLLSTVRSSVESILFYNVEKVSSLIRKVIEGIQDDTIRVEN